MTTSTSFNLYEPIYRTKSPLNSTTQDLHDAITKSAPLSVVLSHINKETANTLHEGYTPLHRLFNNETYTKIEQEEIFNKLIECGANVNILSACSDEGDDINQLFESEGLAALHVACEKGNLKIVQLLVDTGAVIDLLSEEGFSPLYIAAEKGHQEIVKYLLTKMTKDSINQPCSAQELTALHIACIKNHSEIVNLLVQKGAQLTIAAGNKTALHLIAQYGDEESLSLLSRYFSEEIKEMVNQITSHQSTALHMAIQDATEIDVDLIKKLLEMGENIYALTKAGDTPLILALDAALQDDSLLTVDDLANLLTPLCDVEKEVLVQAFRKFENEKSEENFSNLLKCLTSHKKHLKAFESKSEFPNMQKAFIEAVSYEALYPIFSVKFFETLKSANVSYLKEAKIIDQMQECFLPLCQTFFSEEYGEKFAYRYLNPIVHFFQTLDMEEEANSEIISKYRAYKKELNEAAEQFLREKTENSFQSLRNSLQLVQNWINLDNISLEDKNFIKDDLYHTLFSLLTGDFLSALQEHIKNWKEKGEINGFLEKEIKPLSKLFFSSNYAETFIQQRIDPILALTITTIQSKKRSSPDTHDLFSDMMAVVWTQIPLKEVCPLFMQLTKIDLKKLKTESKTESNANS